MAHVLLYWVLSALILLLVAYIVPGFSISGILSALIAVIVIGFLNATLGLFLKIIGFPLTILTLGLFLLVVNAIVLKVAAALMPGFSIQGFLPAVFAAILLALLHVALSLGMGQYPAYVQGSYARLSDLACLMIGP